MKTATINQFDLINVSNAEIKEYYKAAKDWKSYHNFILNEILEEYKDNESMLQLIKILSKHLHNYSDKDYISVSVERVMKRTKNKTTYRPYLNTMIKEYHVLFNNDYNDSNFIVKNKQQTFIDLNFSDIKDIQIEDEYNGQQYHITFRYDDNVDYDMYVSNFD